jgi:hypothetical protein
MEFVAVQFHDPQAVLARWQSRSGRWVIALTNAFVSANNRLLFSAVGLPLSTQQVVAVMSQRLQAWEVRHPRPAAAWPDRPLSATGTVASQPAGRELSFSEAGLSAAIAASTPPPLSSTLSRWIGAALITVSCVALSYGSAMVAATIDTRLAMAMWLVPLAACGALVLLSYVDEKLNVMSLVGMVLLPAGLGAGVGSISTGTVLPILLAGTGLACVGLGLWNRKPTQLQA